MCSGVRLASLTTNPALYFFTLRTISACSFIGWEQNIKDNPPFRARAMAILSSDTDCIIADTNGMFKYKSDSESFLNFVNGVLRLILSGVHCFVVKPGIKRYSLNVLEISFTICAMVNRVIDLQS